MRTVTSHHIQALTLSVSDAGKKDPHVYTSGENKGLDLCDTGFSNRSLTGHPKAEASRENNLVFAKRKPFTLQSVLPPRRQERCEKVCQPCVHLTHLDYEKWQCLHLNWSPPECRARTGGHFLTCATLWGAASPASGSCFAGRARHVHRERL